MNVMGQRIVILGSLQAATDLFEKKGTIYSDRPLTVAQRMIGHGDYVPSGKYDAGIKQDRTMIAKAVGTPRLVEDFMPMMLEAVQDLCINFIEKPANFRDHLRL